MLDWIIDPRTELTELRKGTLMEICKPFPPPAELMAAVDELAEVGLDELVELAELEIDKLVELADVSVADEAVFVVWVCEAEV